MLAAAVAPASAQASAIFSDGVVVTYEESDGIPPADETNTVTVTYAGGLVTISDTTVTR